MPLINDEEIESAVRYLGTAAFEDADSEGASDLERGVLQVKGKITPEHFFGIEDAKDCGMAAAVDGSSAVVLDCCSFLVGAMTAGHALVRDGMVIDTKVRPVRLLPVSYLHRDAIYARLFSEALGSDPPDVPDTLEALVGRARTLAEWLEAEAVLQRLFEGGLLIMDGSLWAGMPGIAPLIKRIADAAMEAGIAMVGVSKRSMLYTGHRPIVPLLARLGRKVMGDRCWFYPLDLKEYAERLFGATYIAHLHPMAHHAFRVDILPTTELAAEDVLERLVSLSNDPGYLGYPYPLARVHNEVVISRDMASEISLYLKRGLAASGGEIELLERYEEDFHTVLGRGQ
ncbi:MAG: DNA double-strand break repair nuclease NurA [Candidatus Thermoplasmatota archaeon]